MKYVSGWLFLLLAGCNYMPVESPQPEPVVMPEMPAAKPQVEEVTPLLVWLDTARSFQSVSPQEARLRLDQIKEVSDTLLSFKRALLYQQLSQLEGWVNARDLFRELANDTTLDRNQRDLAQLYQSYNQANINAQQQLQNKDRLLASQQQQIESLQNQISELELKVKALTTLEQSISDRKAQSVEE